MHTGFRLAHEHFSGLVSEAKQRHCGNAGRGPGSPLPAALEILPPRMLLREQRATGTARCDIQSKYDHHSHFTAQGTEARQACLGPGALPPG